MEQETLARQEVRLQKVIAQAGVASRRKAEELIVQGRVLVNSKKVTTLGTTVDPTTDVVVVDGKPIRASKRSAEWCLKAIDRCWEKKSRLIRASEKADAASAYDVARTAYRKILEQTRAE